jgi:tRNA threonylcarbamoyladenosine biosynthesis protein TsaB
MIKALAIETSGRVGSVAAVRDGQVLQEISFPHGLRHAAGIVRLLDELCIAQGWRPRELSELYISIGPGSFTGLRIAVTLAKSMALAVGLKVVAVPSVRVLAMNAPPEARHVLIVLDARRGQAYCARFERADDGGSAIFGQVWLETRPAHVEALDSALADCPQPIYLLGEGIDYHRQQIVADADIVITPAESWRARAEAVAALGWEMGRAGQFTEAQELAPLYLRLPEAQEKLYAEAGASG